MEKTRSTLTPQICEVWASHGDSLSSRGLLCCDVTGYESFGGLCCLLIQDEVIGEERSSMSRPWKSLLQTWKERNEVLCTDKRRPAAGPCQDSYCSVTSIHPSSGPRKGAVLRSFLLAGTGL